MKNVVSKVLIVVALVMSITGFVCLWTSTMDLSKHWVLNAGQICVCIGMTICIVENIRRKIKKQSQI